MTNGWAGADIGPGVFSMYTTMFDAEGNPSGTETVPVSVAASRDPEIDSRTTTRTRTTTNTDGIGYFGRPLYSKSQRTSKGFHQGATPVNSSVWRPKAEATGGSMRYRSEYFP